jgi:pimeloyl-ACP methyl ester carboxylesterase
MNISRRTILRGSAAAVATMGIEGGLLPASAKIQAASGNTHVTTPTRYVEANNVRYAYRRFGAKSGVPIILLQHFRGVMDNWDPLVTDGLAKGRSVILLDTPGLGGSTGAAPLTSEAAADDVVTFMNAIGLKQADILGFSLGGYVAQSLTLRHPEFVRKLVLVGTGPRNGEPAKDPKIPGILSHPSLTDEDFLYLFFTQSEASQAAGKAFLSRRHLRTKDVDPESTPELMKAQVTLTIDWRAPRGERYADLKSIKQPTLVVNGTSDILIPSINAFNLSQNIPNARLILYPDAGHGSHYQYPEMFLSDVVPFLV